MAFYYHFRLKQVTLRFLILSARDRHLLFFLSILLKYFPITTLSKHLSLQYHCVSLYLTNFFLLLSKVPPCYLENHTLYTPTPKNSLISAFPHQITYFQSVNALFLVSIFIYSACGFLFMKYDLYFFSLYRSLVCQVLHLKVVGKFLFPAFLVSITFFSTTCFRFPSAAVCISTTLHPPVQDGTSFFQDTLSTLFFYSFLLFSSILVFYEWQQVIALS